VSQWRSDPSTRSRLQTRSRRHSRIPALEILKRLRDKGADISYADPHVPSVTLDGRPLKSIEPTAQALAAADCVLILTDHPEFDYCQVVELAPLVIDTRNATWRIPASVGKVVAL
jgi:UDP-N-acetyl-D-glucosamine dehydrogenase